MSSRIEARLSSLSRDIAAQRAEVAVLEEQLRFQQDVADDARVRALVAETPLADRELRVAEEDLRRVERVAAEARHRLARLVSDQDRLLERLGGKAAD